MDAKVKEIYESFAMAVAHRFENRLVVYYRDAPLDECVLVDFSNAGEEEFTDDKVCVWSVQRNIEKDGEYAGTEELDYGDFSNYADVLTFLFDTLDGREYDLVVESF